MSTLSSPRYLNRELSWLEFNQRVLAEAENSAPPLLERLKFCAIVASNLDEFFMVRVALAVRGLEAGRATSGPDQFPRRRLLACIAERSHELVARLYRCLRKDLLPQLADQHISLVRDADYTPDDILYLRRQFEETLFPVLTPLAIDPSHPFPILTGGAVYLLFRVESEAAEKTTLGFSSQTEWIMMQVPVGMNRFLPLPGPAGATRLALLDDVIARFSGETLSGYDVKGIYPFRITRDAEMQVDEEQSENLMTAIEEELHSRRRGAPVRLELAANTPKRVQTYLQSQFELDASETYLIPDLLNLRSLFDLLGHVDRPDLENTPWVPQPHPSIAEDADLFAVIREGDLLFHHPFQSFDPVIRLVEQAADDPDVLAIKMTLYRVSGESPIVRALVRAAENNKQVTIIVELRARFDEEANIQWARRLDRAGAHVIYGIMGYKIHSKALLIVRREADGIQRYAHLATGNYNDKTAKLYTDLGIMTTRQDFGHDISAFFNVITGYSQPPLWRCIEMAPTGLRSRLLTLIDREIEKHSPEAPGLIRAKCNALIDPEVIDALYRASAAGVRVELIIRGLCRLRPGVKGLSENIRVISIIDRYLEHPRIYHFKNGGSDEVYLSSADWMERNLDRRIELLFPVLDNTVKREVLFIIDAGLADNCKAWTLKDSTYSRVKRGKRPVRHSQKTLHERACALAHAHAHDAGDAFIAVPLKN
ncbi:MAG: polyphosphate kinase 1 [Planctomycetota bacterium]|jgi:polyphosphate kinase